MQPQRLLTVGAVLALLAVLVLGRVPNVFAHEGREVGEYEVEFGWQIEPAYAGVLNGPEIFIHEHGDEEAGVEGVEKTLKLKVIFGNQSKELKLEPVFEAPGNYKVSLTPTRPGDYTFELTGKIGDTVVKEQFTSADGDFSTIEPASDLLFPDSKLDMVSLQTQIDALKKEIEALKAAKK